MLTSPITLTIGGTPRALALRTESNYTSVYGLKASLLEITLTIRNRNEATKVGGLVIERHEIDLVYTTFDATDGLPTNYQVYTVMRIPRGKDIALAVNALLGLNVYLAASSGAAATAIAGWEN